MRAAPALLAAAVSLSLAGPAWANTYGSVEPIANSAVIDTGALRAQPLAVREAFAERLLRCGIVDQVIHALGSTGAVSTINDLNTRFEVAAGGFAGRTNPAYVYTVIDSGPNAAGHHDVAVLTDSLGYVLSQGSAFLLDADDPSSFDFPANYVVLNFAAPPSIAQSAALFETVGRIDPEIFETDTSGYTQYGRAYLSLQSFVPDAQFIAGYVQAAQEFGVEYTPVVNGEPSLFQGGAAFPGNDWTDNPKGEDYLARIPMQSHRALRALRDFHLRVTRDVLRRLAHGPDDHASPHSDHRLRDVTQFKCR
jgi:hypothetical protein